MCGLQQNELQRHIRGRSRAELPADWPAAFGHVQREPAKNQEGDQAILLGRRDLLIVSKGGGEIMETELYLEYRNTGRSLKEFINMDMPE